MRFVLLATLIFFTLAAAIGITMTNRPAHTPMSVPARETESVSATSSNNEATPECRHETSAFHCVKYVRNYDADTITVDIPDVHPLIGRNVSVRVNGIDAPEIRGANDCEKKSARIAKNLIENVLKRAKRIDLVNVERDKYFRILADVEADGRSLKDVLFKNGLATAYDGGTKKKMDWCAAAQGKTRIPAEE